MFSSISLFLSTMTAASRERVRICNTIRCDIPRSPHTKELTCMRARWWPSLLFHIFYSDRIIYCSFLLAIQ
jgi:hypothetical protein